MRATISILGLYNLNNALFDDIALPAGVDQSLLVNNLVTDLAELELIYSDYNFMKFMIHSPSPSRSSMGSAVI